MAMPRTMRYEWQSLAEEMTRKRGGGGGGRGEKSPQGTVPETLRLPYMSVII